MSDEDLRHDDDLELRAAVQALRAEVPARDEAARSHAHATLLAHIGAAATPAGAGVGADRPGLAAGRAQAGAQAARPPYRRRRVRRLPRRWLAGTLAGLLALSGGGTVAAVLLSTKHTEHLPIFTSSGQLAPQFHVGARLRGYCWTSSLATDARDAYRCMAGNAILDPCFAASAHAKTVACFTDPWSKVTLLSLTRRLPANTNSGDDTLPWALVTADGRRCVMLTGATAPMGGQRINYGCVGGSYLLGDPNRSQSLWTIRSAKTYIPDDRAPISSFPIVAINQTIG